MVQHQPLILGAGILADMIDALSVELRDQALDAVDFAPLC